MREDAYKRALEKLQDLRDNVPAQHTITVDFIKDLLEFLRDTDGV